MSEHEKYEQVGRLAEEYSSLKGQLNHINEKITRTFEACRLLAAQGATVQLRDGKLFVSAPTRPQPPILLEGLLSTTELTEVHQERERLSHELNALASRLKQLAPHLL